MRITFRSSADCDRVLASGICFRNTHLRVVSVDARSRLVYLNDCLAEIPDEVVKRFFHSFGEVHTISRSCNQAFPGICDGNHVIKITLIIPRMCLQSFPSLVLSVACGTIASRLPALSARSSAIAASSAHSVDSAAGAAALVITPVSVPTPGFLPVVLLLWPLEQFLLLPRLLLRLMSLPPIHPALLTRWLSRMQRCQTRTTSHFPVLSLMILSVWKRWLLCRPANLTPLVVVGLNDDTARFHPVSPVSWLAWIPPVGEVPGHSFFKTFRGVWEDVFSWEESQSRKSHYRANTLPKQPPSC